MIEEQGTVVAVEAEAVWVETIKSSTCGACKARNGCGHHLLNQQQGGQRARLRVPCDGSQYSVGDPVLLALPEGMLMRAALLVYGLPMLLLFAGALLGNRLPLAGLDGAAIFGVAGLLLGFLINRVIARGPRSAAYSPQIKPGDPHCQVIQVRTESAPD